MICYFSIVKNAFSNALLPIENLRENKHKLFQQKSKSKYFNIVYTKINIAEHTSYFTYINSARLWVYEKSEFFLSNKVNIPKDSQIIEKISM